MPPKTMIECMTMGKHCELKFGTCHQTLHGVKCGPLWLLAHSAPEQSLARRPGVGHSVLWETWQNRPSDH